jgi:hypothetical protein
MRERKPYLIFEEFVDKVNINQFTSDLEKDKLAGQISEAIDNSISVSKNYEKKVYLVFDAHNYFYDGKVINFDFGENHQIDKADLKKIFSHSMVTESVKQGFMPINFQINKYLIDEAHTVTNPLGTIAEKLAVTGELVFSDSNTYYNLKSIVEIYDIKVIDAHIGGYLLNKDLELENGHGLMEISTERINFAVNDDYEYKQFSVEMGFRKILESVYEKLCEVYPKDDSEKAVRFLMEYFPLKQYETDGYVVGDIMLNDLISVFDHIIIDYFNYIFEQLKKQNICCEVYTVLLHDYIGVDFVELLNDNIEIKFVEYQNLTYKNVAPDNVKAFIAVKKFEEKSILIEE